MQAHRVYATDPRSHNCGRQGPWSELRSMKSSDSFLSTTLACRVMYQCDTIHWIIEIHHIEILISAVFLVVYCHPSHLPIQAKSCPFHAQLSHPLDFSRDRKPKQTVTLSDIVKARTCQRSGTEYLHQGKSDIEKSTGRGTEDWG